MSEAINFCSFYQLFQKYNRVSRYYNIPNCTELPRNRFYTFAIRALKISKKQELFKLMWDPCI